MKYIVYLFLTACGASFVGPATKTTDRCQGHLDCGESGCCMDAQLDGAGYICLPPGNKAVCEYTGQGIQSKHISDAGVK